MTEQNINVVVTMQIKTSSVTEWLGKTDKNGNAIDELVWKAKAYFMGSLVAETNFTDYHKTEAAAIRALRVAIKATNELWKD